ncbi:hypothetical protein BGZ83_010082 [Gryganskiella cystojenkinii]|nr:hypothetical protein BGZ83_010082 [Gryganskiella cystojenkinii]
MTLDTLNIAELMPPSISKRVVGFLFLVMSLLIFVTIVVSAFKVSSSSPGQRFGMPRTNDVPDDCEEFFEDDEKECARYQPTYSKPHGTRHLLPFLLTFLSLIAVALLVFILMPLLKVMQSIYSYAKRLNAQGSSCDAYPVQNQPQQSHSSDHSRKAVSAVHIVANSIVSTTASVVQPVHNQPPQSQALKVHPPRTIPVVPTVADFVVSTTASVAHLVQNQSLQSQLLKDHSRQAVSAVHNVANPIVSTATSVVHPVHNQPPQSRAFQGHPSRTIPVVPDVANFIMPTTAFVAHLVQIKPPQSQSLKGRSRQAVPAVPIVANPIVSTAASIVHLVHLQPPQSQASQKSKSSKGAKSVGGKKRSCSEARTKNMRRGNHCSRIHLQNVPGFRHRPCKRELVNRSGRSNNVIEGSQTCGQHRIREQCWRARLHFEMVCTDILKPKPVRFPIDKKTGQKRTLRMKRTHSERFDAKEIRGRHERFAVTYQVYFRAEFIHDIRLKSDLGFFEDEEEFEDDVWWDYFAEEYPTYPHHDKPRFFEWEPAMQARVDSVVDTETVDGVMFGLDCDGDTVMYQLPFK